MKIYIVSTYGEYGAENVQATLDKSKVKELVSNLQLFNLGETEIATLDNLLELDECDPNGNDITDGWGGIQLHIVEVSQ